MKLYAFFFLEMRFCLSLSIQRLVAQYWSSLVNHISDEDPMLSIWLSNVFRPFQNLLRSQHTFGFLYPMRQLVLSLGKVVRPSPNFRQNPGRGSSSLVIKSFSLGRLIELLWYRAQLRKLSMGWNWSLINCTVRYSFFFGLCLTTLFFLSQLLFIMSLWDQILTFLFVC